jgi:hypothetical protein
MTAEELHLLKQIPLHVVATILAELDSIEQLGSVILAHRVFLVAFNDNRLHVTTSIIRNQIPASLLPFATALHESTKIDAGDYDAVRSLLTRLAEAIFNPPRAISSLVRFSISEAAIISKSYKAIGLLCQDFANISIPLLNNRLGLDHPQEILQQEKFRLGRAFYRYQLMCNLFCLGEEEALSEEPSLQFFRIFSPWVNEQLICVYAYLEAKVCKGESVRLFLLLPRLDHYIPAFDEIAAHDVEWGEMPIDWTPDAHYIPYVQEIVSLPGTVIYSGSYLTAPGSFAEGSRSSALSVVRRATMNGSFYYHWRASQPGAISVILLDSFITWLQTKAY